MRRRVLIKIHVYPQNPGKKVFHTPVKNISDPDWPEIKFPDLTRPDPKIFLKMCHDPEPVTVWSGPGKLGVSGWPAGL